MDKPPDHLFTENWYLSCTWSSPPILAWCVAEKHYARICQLSFIVFDFITMRRIPRAVCMMTSIVLWLMWLAMGWSWPFIFWFNETVHLRLSWPFVYFNHYDGISSVYTCLIQHFISSIDCLSFHVSSIRSRHLFKNPYIRGFWLSPFFHFHHCYTEFYYSLGFRVFHLCLLLHRHARTFIKKGSLFLLLLYKCL